MSIPIHIESNHAQPVHLSNANIMLLLAHFHMLMQSYHVMKNNKKNSKKVLHKKKTPTELYQSSHNDHDRLE